MIPDYKRENLDGFHRTISRLYWDFARKPETIKGKDHIGVFFAFLYAVKRCFREFFGMFTGSAIREDPFTGIDTDRSRKECIIDTMTLHNLINVASETLESWFWGHIVVYASIIGLVVSLF